MIDKERRKHRRIDSVNLTNYICFDEDLREESQGMARTLNISEAGLLLESNSHFHINRTLSLNISLKEDILSVDGQIVFTNQDESGITKSGIEFKKINENGLTLLKKHINTSYY